MRLTAALAAVALALGGVGVSILETASPAAAAGPILLSQGKPATASSPATGAVASRAVDGNPATRWESAHGVDPQWIQVDLGARSDISEVQIDWEAANAKDYTIQVSDDGAAWTVAATKTGMAGGARNDVVPLTGVTGRYVKIEGTARNLTYGYSIWELRVYGSVAVSSPATPTGKTVEVVGGYGDWKLYVDGAPYIVKGLTWGPKTTGAGAISAAKLDEYLDDLVSLGVNTIRTWGTDADSHVLFDAAADHGIRVIAGFWIQPGGGPGSGGCPDFVAGTGSYLDAVRSDVASYVAQYKDDPAVLMWSLGNESLLGLGNCYTGSQLEAQRNAYAAFVEELAQDVKAIDANHPVTSTDAWVGAWPYLKANAPSLDLYAINAYGALSGVQAAWSAGGYTVPYVVTETGPQGEWETAADATGKPSEPSDAAKAQAYTDAWNVITANAGVALGATMFHFGTETDFGGVWFNLFPGEKKRAAWYAVAAAYGGPAASGNRPPAISGVTASAISVPGGSTFTLNATVSDPESDPTTVVVQKSGNYATGDGSLTAAASIPAGAGSWTVTAPADAGVWKFYVTATDDHGNIAYAPVSVTVTDPSGINVALGKAASASSAQDPAANAVDGNTGTKWGSALDGSWNGSDDEWFQVDLGAVYSVDKVKLLWEGAAYGRDYDIETSVDGVHWTTVAEQRDQTAGTHSVPFAATDARYVRMQGIHRGSTFGYSFYEFQVFSATGQPVGTQTSCSRTIPQSTITGSASHGNAALALDNTYTWPDWGGSRWDSGVEEQPPGSGNWVGRDGEWIQLDLGAPTPVCGVKTVWEAAYAKDFDVLASNDGSSWTTVAQVRDVASAGYQLTRFPETTARYLRILAVTRATQYGVSIWEVNVLAPQATVFPTTSLFGDRTLVFEPSMSAADIQAAIDAVFIDQEADQFGEGRWQFLFTPGEYTVDARIGFYTALSGAGLNPGEVEIHGGDWVDADWFNMNATQNFWRSVENVRYVPTNGTGRWAVSQAAPLRRVDVAGDLQLNSRQFGWASGGFVSDSRVSGTVFSGAQQQWYTRDSTLGAWDGSNWNMVFSGVQGTLPAGTWPTPPITDVATTGTVAEKPFVYLSGSNVNAASDWSVFVPGVRSGTTGVTWADGTDASDGASLPLTGFFIVKEGATAAQVNAALAAGKNILFTPGVYRMDQTLQVTRPNTVILGLGLATIIPTGDSFGMHVADVDGVRLAGLLFDAAVTESPALLVVGDKGGHADHSANPIVLNDVYMRVGGPVAGKVKAAMIVNADDTVIDHLWSWRGDHGEGIGWNANTSDYGLVVNGDDVSAYGLFVEHYQKYNVLWKGQGGRTIFYQNELPYDVPDQAAWNHDGVRGWAAYKVDAGVTTHEAWGLGSYSNFTSDTEEDEIVVDGGFEVPKGEPGIRMHHLLTVSLGGEGIYAAIINGVGERQEETAPKYLAEYPVPGDPDAGIDPPAAPADPATDPETAPAAAPVSVVLSASTVRQGGVVHVEASGLPVGAPVDVTLHSTPQLLATAVADASGRISLDVRIPASTPVGAHTVVVSSGSASGSAALTVTAFSLSATGAAVGGLVALAVAALMSGAVLLGLRRRRVALEA
ncbi:MAG: discoidin domain-containing protein [Micrococcales bacterium]|nr:discoidin domain-containing protein [Micrococcales bacterium]OJX69708.1 MAG: hypothetical protein BGO94_14640 [Micrococcales bacterium 72-143]